ncbi:hypothetical protein PMIN06_010796 [Paraphaeosphaeria minitans]
MRSANRWLGSSALLLSYACLSLSQSLVVPTTPLPNWDFIGCYTDAVGVRSLGDASTSNSNMTNTNCVNFCSKGGYAYAGTEYSQECWCGRNLSTTANLSADGDCNIGCSGNAEEACGGSNRLTIFNNTASGQGPPFTDPGTNGYRSLGCYTDRTAERTLDVEISGNFPGGYQNSTVANCISACSNGGYTYAGLEYFGECWCGNALRNGGASASDQSSCNTLCNGNQTEFCGGAGRLNLYTNSPPPSSGSSIAMSTISISAVVSLITPSSSQKTVQSSTFITASASSSTSILPSSSTMSTTATSFTASSSTVVSSSSSSAAPVFMTNSASSTTATRSSTNFLPPGLSSITVGSSSPTTSSSTSTLATSKGSESTVTGVPAALPNDWNYKGCWTDNANGRVFANQLPDANDMTVERCIGNCTANGFGVAGIEYSYQCFCGNYLMNGAAMTSQSECNTACAGNASEFCGAGNRLSVYSNSTANLTVYAVPTTQTTRLPSNWKYAGCLRDDSPGGVRALPYQLTPNNNNTANNCISQCSAFGYAYGGMEYGNECYCGDLGDIQTANVDSAPESDCSFTCSGNPTTICGGARRLSLYQWTGPNLAKWNYATGKAAGAYQFLIGGVVVPLVTQAARNGKITFLEKSGTGPPNSTGAYELDVAQLNNFTGAWRPMHVKTDIFCSASLTLPDKAGRQLNVGGWALDATFGVRLYWPDGSPGVWGQNDWQENVKVLKMQNGRWYPTAMIMSNGTVLVVGGEDGSNGKPVPTLEILPTQGPVVYADYLDRTDPNNLYPFLAVLPSGGIFIQYYNEAAILDEVTLAVKKQLPNVPASVNRPDGGRTYPNEGTAVLLPQYAPYTDPLKVLICGGSTPYQGLALDNCVTIAPDVPNANWTLERMPSKRVLSCMVALPDGTYLIINGAHEGQAGFGLAADPNLNAVLYDPTLPLNNRFTVLANTTVARMYHSEAILMDDGRILVSGSDPEDDRFPQEYRVEVFIPPYLMGTPVQPVVSIAASQSDWAYSGLYTFTVDQPVAKMSLLGATGSTHGNSMGQRTIFPAFVCSGNSCTVTAPPDAHTCPPGWFQLFALNAEGVPSKAVWVRIGGDPAQLGNWPQQGGFKLPGM